WIPVDTGLRQANEKDRFLGPSGMTQKKPTKGVTDGTSHFTPVLCSAAVLRHVDTAGSWSSPGYQAPTQRVRRRAGQPGHGRRCRVCSVWLDGRIYLFGSGNAVQREADVDR